LLMIVGRDAVTSYMTTEAFWNAQQPKELYWIDGATHVSLYDEEPHVTLAIAKLTQFFRSNLGKTTSGDHAENPEQPMIAREQERSRR
jgi:uncharacterized protein